MNPCYNGTAVSKEWIDELTEELRDLRLWMVDPCHIDDVIEGIADVLVEKHHDYGEQNLVEFGELGILVRASDKVARLKNLLDKNGIVKDESREDTWRDLAGYAIQALILMKRITLRSSASTPEVDIFELRRNRLIRGFCPDCGEGVLLRRQQWDRLSVNLFCSERCGFDVDVDLFDLDCDTTEVIHRLAGREAVEEQKL